MNRAIALGALLLAATPVWSQGGRVRFLVLDRAGAVVRDTVVSLMDRQGKHPVRSVRADRNGEALLGDLEIGVNRIRVHYDGFKEQRLAVTISSSDELKRTVILEVDMAKVHFYTLPAEN